MLIRFSIENFLSYNQKQTFSMIAGRTQNHLKHIYQANDVGLLKLGAIYGANASGKSKMFEAMKFASHVVKHNLPSDSQEMFCKQSEVNELKASTFEFEFYSNGSFYAYGFSAILKQQKITAEWLYQLNPQKDKQES
ncbi:MAG: AAA family ATPase, partial [Anaerovorax sp.]